MMAGAARPGALWQRLLLAVVAPFVFVLVCDVVIRFAGVDTDLARNENFEIGVPVWLLGDESWVDIQRDRLERPRGVRAADVAWLQHFEEARYIHYKLKPSISVAATNPFNEIELAKGTTFLLESNSSGFRTREFGPKTGEVDRIVTLGDSSTFGWGVDPEYTYQRLLEQRLDRAGAHAEVFNLGISGHTSRHGIGVFEHYARALEPDVLVISFGANDGRWVLQATDETLAVDETWLGTVRAVLLRFETFKLLRRTVLSLYDPFERSRAQARSAGTNRQLVQSVPRAQYVANLRYLVQEGRARGAVSILLAVCAPEEYVQGMREVARSEDIVLVDALGLFAARLKDLQAHRLYADEVRYYEQLYGVDAMAANWRFYVTTDGCHPGRAGHSLIADALADAVRSIPRARVAREDADGQ